MRIIKIPYLLKLLFVLAPLLYSCSGHHYTQRIRSLNQDFYALEDHPSQWVPKLTVISEPLHFLKLKKKIPVQERYPASLNRGPHKTPLFSSTQKNKDIYFLTLYQQYRSLSEFSLAHINRNIKHCPSFHSSFLELKEKRSELFKQAQLQSLKPSYLSFFSSRSPQLKSHFSAYYPEFNLPLSSQGFLYNNPQSIKDFLRTRPQIFQNPNKTQKLINHALRSYLDNTYYELQELCENGSSENYYVYENLSRYIEKQKTFSPLKANLQVLLKTTLFYNWALIESLTDQIDLPSQRTPASSAYDQNSSPSRLPRTGNLTQKLGIPWISLYFKMMIQKRN